MSTIPPEASNSLTPQEAMFNEAMSAIQSGDRARARDLLTRLLKTGQDNAEYWVWMSAVVDTPKERIYCLNEAKRLDPQNAAAKRGLVMLGALPPEQNLVLPVRYQKRNWQTKVAGMEEGEKAPKIRKSQFALMGVALLAILGIVAFAISYVPKQLSAAQRPLTIIYPTDMPTLITVTTPTVARVLSGSPTPLWMLLSATYTPTPQYVNTLHPRTEAFRMGMRAFGKGDWKSAQTGLIQAATAEPNAPDIAYYLGETYRMQGNTAQALQTFNQVIKDHPDFAPAYLGRARVEMAANPGDMDGAQNDIETVLQKDPNYGEGYLGLAELQLQAHNYKAALTALDQAAARLPDSPLVYLDRAQAYLGLGDSKNGLENADRANKLDITLLDAYRYLGQALQMEGDIPGSLNPLTTYVTYKKDDPAVWNWLAKAYLDKEDTRQALNALDQTLRLDNRQQDAYLLRGQILLDTGKTDDALSDFRAVLRFDKKSYPATLGAGIALMDLSYPGDAYVQFEAANGLAKEGLQKAEALYWRAQSLEKLGQIDVAARDYKSLVAMPKESVKDEWVTFAKARLEALVKLTPSPKPKSPTPTVTVTSTRQPTRTPTPTFTRQPTRTASPTRTPLPTKTPLPTATAK